MDGAQALASPLRRRPPPRRRRLLLGALALLLLAPAAIAAEPVRIYGIELEARRERDRLLVFARGPLEVEREDPDRETVLLRFPNSLLDPSATRRIEPQVGSAVTSVDLFQIADASPPEVRIQISRAPGLEPELSQRGGMLAADFVRPPGMELATLSLRFEESELAEVVRLVARATEQPMVFDDSLQGRVSLLAPERVTRSEALELLRAALHLKGYVAVATAGGPQRIVAVEELGARARWSLEPGGGDGDSAVATLVPLRSADAETVVDTLRPWVGDGGLALPLVPTESVILAGTEAQVASWLTLVHALDEAAELETLVLPLRHRSAYSVADTAEAILSGRPGAPPRLEIVADGRSRSILARGSRAALAELRRLVHRLDRPLPSGGAVEVVEVRHADPEALAETLRELAADAPFLAGSADVTVHPPTRSLLLSGEARARRALLDLARELDQSPPQIHVEVTVVEVSSAEELALGVDAFLPIGNQDTSSFGTVRSNPSGGGFLDPGAGQRDSLALRFTRAPLVIPIVGPDGNPLDVLVPRETVLITADDGSFEAQLLMRPHLLAAAGVEHELFVGNEVPIPVERRDGPDGLSALQTRLVIERRDVGLRLRVLPTAGLVGGVRIDLELEMSQVTGPAGDRASLGPILDKSTVSGRLLLDDGEVAVLAGNSRRSYTESVNQAPFFGDIPILGWLVKRSEERWSDATLMVAVQAWIHRDPGELIGETVARRLDLQRSLVAPGQGLGIGRPVVLAGTRSRPRDAEALARRVAGEGPAVEQVSWEWQGAPRIDVYLTGFETLRQASAAASRLARRGLRPRVMLRPARRE